MNRNVVNLKIERPSRCDAGFDQIFHNLILAINGDRLAAGEFRHIDVMTPSLEADKQPVVAEALALEAFAHSHRDHQIHRSLFEHAGTNTLDHIFTAAVFDNYGVNSV